MSSGEEQFAAQCDESLARVRAVAAAVGGVREDREVAEHECDVIPFDRSAG